MRRIVTPTRLTHLLRLSGLAALALAVSACGDSGEGATVSSPPAATATATAVATEPVNPGITSVREVDFTDPAVIGPIIDRFGGGEIEPQRVLYVDLTGDGADEAFVFVESGGTMGDLGAALVGIEDGRATLLGAIEATGRVDLRFPEVGGGVVVATEGVWEASDALCCPSSLRERTYEWGEGGFTLVDEQVVDNPDVD